ncbi:MAG: FAD-dependent oxidoreductase [Candidatus Eremiobacterota bacterium]
MSPGTPDNPLKVAVIGAGPTGFYTAEWLQKDYGEGVRVDMFDRLPTPFGLVRGGVAPDHQKIKSVTAIYDKIAAHPGFRYFGNVEVGRDLSLDDLKRCYHQVVYCTGAQTDRSMGIPGEDLQGSYAATEFVGWYNGHPDYRDRTFNLQAESVAVVGVGNVAVDVARILCRTPEELATTDIADYALEALTHSRIREVTMLGRRGPAQAAFTLVEVRELGELSAADALVPAEDMELDPASQAEVAADKMTGKKVEVLREFSRRTPSGKPRVLNLRFLWSPVEVLGDDQGRVRALKLVRNVLAEENGKVVCRPTERVEELPVQMVFRSVGYKGVALPDLPFDARSGTVPNDRGRTEVPGVYVAGWIKRGPSGVIGTNKPCAKETVETMKQDGTVLSPTGGDIQDLLKERGIRAVTYPAWQELDKLEVARGQAQGRPRVKFTTVEEMLQAVHGSPA